MLEDEKCIFIKKYFNDFRGNNYDKFFYKTIDRRGKIPNGSIRWWSSKYFATDILHSAITRIKIKFGTVKRTAWRIGRKFNLSEKYVRDILVKGCHYCNDPVIWHTGYSIDRKDTNKDYIKGNVVASCKECNFFKGRQSYKAMMEIVKSKRFRNWKSSVPKRWRNKCRFDTLLFSASNVYCIHQDKRNWTKAAKYLFIGDLESNKIKNNLLKFKKKYKVDKKLRVFY